MSANTNLNNSSDEQLIESLLSFTGELDLEDIIPDTYSFDIEGRGVGPETRVSDDMLYLALVEDIVNHEEAIIDWLLKKNGANKDEFDTPSEVFDEYATGDERMELRGFDSEEDHTRTFESYDNGIGMTGEEAARHLATAHDSGTDKRDNDLFQGGHGKGSLVVIGSSDVVVVLTKPMDSNRLYAVVVTSDDKDTKVLRNENGDIPSIRLGSAIEMYGESFFEGSGTMVRMVNYDMVSKRNCPNRITGDGFRRKLGYRIARVHNLELIDMIDGSKERFVGSYNTAKNNTVAFSDRLFFDLSDEVGGLPVEAEVFVEKTPEVRDKLFEKGKIDRCHAGQKSKNKGTKMKDLLGTMAPPVRFICKSSVHETLSQSWLDRFFDSIDDDILIFVKCGGNDQFFDSRRDSLAADKIATQIKNALEKKLRKSDNLFRADERRDNDEKVDTKGGNKDDESEEVSVSEMAHCTYTELKEFDGKASRNMEPIVKYWYNKMYSTIERAAEDGVHGAEIALWISKEYGWDKNFEMVHLGDDYSGSVGDLAILDTDPNEIVRVIELKISEYGGDGTRFNPTTDIFHLAGVFDRRIPRKCTDIKESYDENIERELRKYHYPSNLSSSDSNDSIREQRARYLRDEVLDGHDEEHIIKNPDGYESDVVEAARIKDIVESYGRSVIEDCIRELIEARSEVDNKRLKALAAFLTAGIHTKGHIQDAMSEFEKGKGVKDIINSNYSVAKIHIKNGGVSCEREDTMSLVDNILDSEVVIKSPSEKENGDMCKYLEIGCSDSSLNSGEEYLCLFKLQFNWRNIFQGVTSFSIEGMEGEFFRQNSDC